MNYCSTRLRNPPSFHSSGPAGYAKGDGRGHNYALSRTITTLSRVEVYSTLRGAALTHLECLPPFVGSMALTLNN